MRVILLIANIIGFKLVNKKPDRMAAMQNIIDAVKVDFIFIKKIRLNAARRIVVLLAPRN